MRHTVFQIARSKFLDGSELQAFASENREKYGISGDGDDAYTSTWYVNDLVDDFRKSLGDDFPAHRQRQIDLQREERESTASGPKF